VCVCDEENQIKRNFPSQKKRYAKGKRRRKRVNFMSNISGRRPDKPRAIVRLRKCSVSFKASQRP
jgi:hypothetical protein